MITSVVTADFDCMQLLSRAKAFSFPFSTVAIFWLLDWLVVEICADSSQ